MVLEPIVNLDVTVPDQFMGDITGALATKRARINGTDSLRGGELIIKAQVPLAEISEYSNELKALTAGRGRYSIELSHYEALPANVQRNLIEAYRPRHEEDEGGVSTSKLNNVSDGCRRQARREGEIGQACAACRTTDRTHANLVYGPQKT